MDAEHNAEHSEADPPVRGKSAPSAATIAQFHRKGIPRRRFFRSAFANVAPAQCGRSAADVPKALPNSTDAASRRVSLGAVLVAPDGPAPGQSAPGRVVVLSPALCGATLVPDAHSGPNVPATPFRLLRLRAVVVRHGDCLCQRPAIVRPRELVGAATPGREAGMALPVAAPTCVPRAAAGRSWR